SSSSFMTDDLTWYSFPTPHTPFFIFPMLRPPPPFTLFPYTTLFRSLSEAVRVFRQPSAFAEGQFRDPVRVELDRGIALRQRQMRSEEHTSELQSPYDLVCRLLLEKKKKQSQQQYHST